MFYIILCNVIFILGKQSVQKMHILKNIKMWNLFSMSQAFWSPTHQIDPLEVCTQ